MCRIALVMLRLYKHGFRSDSRLPPWSRCFHKYIVLFVQDVIVAEENRDWFSCRFLDILIAFPCKRHVTQVDLAVSHQEDHLNCFTKFIMVHQFLISVDFLVGSS